MKAETLAFEGYSVTLDSENLRFDEATLTKYIQTESGFYDNFGASLAKAERNLQKKETLHEALYAERFVEAKEMGGSDKLAEGKAKADQDVVASKDEIVQAKYIVNRLKQHLRAWDKNHDNAQSLGHMLRKELDKLNAEINMRVHNIDRSEIPGLDKAVDETVATEWPAEPDKAEVVEVIPTASEVASDDSAGFETDLDMSNLY
jgi:hypothetical protein